MNQVHVIHSNVLPHCWKVKLVLTEQPAPPGITTIYDGMLLLGDKVGKFEYSLFDEFKRKKEACVIGHEFAIEQKAELYVHNKNGKFKIKNSYGHDPESSKG